MKNTNWKVLFVVGVAAFLAGGILTSPLSGLVAPAYRDRLPWSGPEDQHIAARREQRNLMNLGATRDHWREPHASADGGAMINGTSNKLDPSNHF